MCQSYLEHLECSLQPSPPGCFTKKLSEARGNGIGFVAAGEAAPPSLLAVQLVLGIRRSARAVQHAGPAVPWRLLFPGPRGNERYGRK